MSADNTPLTFSRDRGQHIPLLTQVYGIVIRSILLVLTMVVGTSAYATSVTSTIPVSNAQIIAAISTITLNFDALVLAVDVTAQNLVVSSAENGLVPGVFSGGGTSSIVFTPTAAFESGDRITVTVIGALVSPAHIFQFRVASALVLNPTTVERVVSTAANSARSLHVGDVDGDGDLDILSASLLDDKIAWYENDGAADPSFTERVVSTTADFASSVHVAM